MSKSDIIVPYNFTPRDYQLKIFQALDGTMGVPDSGFKRVFLRWHRRAGKDLTCFNYMVKRMIEEPGVYYYFFPTYHQGRMVLWENVDKGFKVLNHIPNMLIKRISNQDMVIELINGSVFRVVGTDRMDSVVGTNPRGCVFSEYALQDPTAWALISPILAENNGWAIFNGTPRGTNHMYKLELMAKTSSAWFISVLTVKDSGLESKLSGFIEEDLKMSGREFVDQEYYVSYSAGAQGSIYGHNIQQATREGRIGCFPPNSSRWVDTFWDIGIDDSTAIWFRQIDGSKKLWIDYYEVSNKDISTIVEVLFSKGYKYKTHYLPHDAGQRKMTGTGYLKTTCDLLEECLRSAGLSADVVQCDRLPVQDGINGVRAKFSQFYFNEGLCAEGLSKLELYHRRWDSKRGVFTIEPVHDSNSHAADALRTVVSAEDYEIDIENQHLTIITDYDILG